MSDEKDEKPAAGINGFLDKQAEKRIELYVGQYARQENGATDEALARRIRWEVGRRAETGKQLDIYEPLRWTGIRSVLGVLGAGAAKMVTDRVTDKSKSLFFGIETGLVISTAINSFIDLTRLYPRWLAGLEGGKNTALMLHKKFDTPPNDQAFSPPPPPKSTDDTTSRGVARHPPIRPTSFLQQAERSSEPHQKQ